MNGKGKEVAGAIIREVAEWPGAQVEIVEAKSHPRAKLKYEGKVLAVTFSATPSSPRSVHHTLADVRRALRKLGAARLKPEPNAAEDEAGFRPKNDRAVIRYPVAGEPATPPPGLADQLAETKGQVAARPEAPTRQADLAAASQPDAKGDEDALRAEFLARVAGITDGVYFGLPADVYHAVPRASSSFLQKINVSPATAWRHSWMDPERPDFDEDATLAQTLGRAYHTARLEPHLFESLYVRELDKADAPKGTLFTGTDIGKVLEEYGLKKSGTVAEQAQRLADAGFPARQLWPLVKAEWEQARAGRTPLPPRHYDQMLTDRDRIGRNSQIAPLLSGGEAEVSIFWTDEHGVEMKARIDYLNRDWWADFKTFDNSRGKPIRQALADAMRFNRYYMQAVIYREAIEAVRLGGLDVIEAQTDDQRALIAALRIKPAELACWYIFQEKGGVPNLFAYEFPFYSVPIRNLFEGDALAGEDIARRDRSREAFKRATQLYLKGHRDVIEAKKTFVLYSQVYAPGEPWFPIDAIARFEDDDFHPYWLAGDLI